MQLLSSTLSLSSLPWFLSPPLSFSLCSFLFLLLILLLPFYILPSSIMCSSHCNFSTLRCLSPVFLGFSIFIFLHSFLPLLPYFPSFNPRSSTFPYLFISHMQLLSSTSSLPPAFLGSSISLSLSSFVLPSSTSSSSAPSSRHTDSERASSCQSGMRTFFPPGYFMLTFRTESRGMIRTNGAPSDSIWRRHVPGSDSVRILE